MPIKIANAPCSWGVIETYKDFNIEYKTFLDQVASIGYHGIELGPFGFLPTDSTKLRSELESRNLTLLGSWVSCAPEVAEMHEIYVENALRTARLMRETQDENCLVILGADFEYVNERYKKVARIQESDGLTAQRWQNFIDGVTKIAEAVAKETGLKTLYHPHGATWIETPKEIEKLFSALSSDLVYFCYDTGHIAIGGSDPVSTFEKYAPRIKNVHFKDCNFEVRQKVIDENLDYDGAISNGVFCRLGKGDVHFGEVIDLIHTCKYSGWIVIEQDVYPGLGDPHQNAIDNYKYLSTLLQVGHF